MRFDLDDGEDIPDLGLFADRLFLFFQNPCGRSRDFNGRLVGLEDHDRLKDKERNIGKNTEEDIEEDAEKDIEKDVVPNGEKTTFTWKDVIALIIAQFEIVMPIALVAVGIMVLLIFLLLKFFHN